MIEEVRKWIEEVEKEFREGRHHRIVFEKELKHHERGFHIKSAGFAVGLLKGNHCINDFEKFKFVAYRKIDHLLEVKRDGKVDVIDCKEKEMQCKMIMEEIDAKVMQLANKTTGDVLKGDYERYFLFENYDGKDFKELMMQDKIKSEQFGQVEDETEILGQGANLKRMEYNMKATETLNNTALEVLEGFLKPCIPKTDISNAKKIDDIKDEEDRKRLARCYEIWKAASVLEPIIKDKETDERFQYEFLEKFKILQKAMKGKKTELSSLGQIDYDKVSYVVHEKPYTYKMRFIHDVPKGVLKTCPLPNAEAARDEMLFRFGDHYLMPIIYEEKDGEIVYKEFDRGVIEKYDLLIPPAPKEWVLGQKENEKLTLNEMIEDLSQDAEWYKEWAGFFLPYWMGDVLGIQAWAIFQGEDYCIVRKKMLDKVNGFRDVFERVPMSVCELLAAPHASALISNMVGAYAGGGALVLVRVMKKVL